MTAVCVFKCRSYLFFLCNGCLCVVEVTSERAEIEPSGERPPDRKCHFNLRTAAVKPGPAHCPAQHFTCSSPATGMDVKTVNFRHSFRPTTSDPFPYSWLVLCLFCRLYQYCLRHQSHPIQFATFLKPYFFLNVNFKYIYIYIHIKWHVALLWISHSHWIEFWTADYTCPNLVMRGFNSLRDSGCGAADSPQPPWVLAKDGACG